ncbi:helix-turn-helix transcriptional regulator [Steroidobacter sp. S1-65]|uniref:Helix-turn-helix transcriptional regulator n=1 Tax=Steroidobacter gossypii TaxID=2805490 RepID=A0ABS1WXS3_9GAMM|nr:helix-turn-helix transcriptional regulator [Steroidobacter gossypii]MBM0105776.1 helix-turn-helix transcriptional regulator [Steroidobacter gossypii]
MSIRHEASIREVSRDYYQKLGAHIALLRKTCGITQAELARAIGVSQQAIFAYELGERRVSVLVLTRISRFFSIPVQELLAMAQPVREIKSKVSPGALHRAAQLQTLSKTEQRFVGRIIDTLEAAANRR